MGAGLNLQQYGTSSVDITQTTARLVSLSNIIAKGKALRWQDTKSFPKAQTYLQVAIKQHFGSFYSFSQASDSSSISLSSARLQTRLDITVMQNLGKNYGRLNANASMHRYQDGRNLRDFRFSYTNQFKKLNYSIDYTHSKTAKNATTAKLGHQLALTLSLPLESKNSLTAPTWFSYNVTTNNDGGANHSASVNGSLLEENRLTYSAGINHSNRSDNSGFASFSLQKKLAQINLGHTYSQRYSNSNLSINGGTILHAGGITLSQPFSNTLILATIPDASAVGFENYANVRTDSHGYAVIPYATPYRRNNLSLKAEDLDDDIEVENTIVQTIPTRGAVLLAEYASKKGYKLLLTVSLPNGGPLSFSAYVNDQAGRQVSMVGPGSQNFLSGIAPADNFTIHWGNEQQHGSRLNSTLLKLSGNAPDLIPTSKKLFEGTVQCS